MKKFLIRLSLFLLPLCIFLLPYFIWDPYKTLRHYDNFYTEIYQDVSTHQKLLPNRGYVSTCMYDEYKDKYNYDSFILGSSRSGNFMIDDWKQYLPNDVSCFHFDGSGESLYLLYLKCKYLSKYSNLSNVLICIDHEMLSTVTPMYGNLFYTPPALVNYENYFSFQFIAFRSFYTPHFFKNYLSFSSVKKYFQGKSLLNSDSTYVLITNEFVKKDNGEERDTSFYPEVVWNMFYDRGDTSTIIKSNIIEDEQYRMLSEIKDILERSTANYRIVINPLYDRKMLNNHDMTILRDLFNDNLYDFSGSNIYTDDIFNYNDPYHFRPMIASNILRIIYEKDSLQREKMYNAVFYKEE